MENRISFGQKMSNLIVLLLSIDFWSIMTHYCVINGKQYQRWLKIATLTVSLLTDNCLVNLTHGSMINGKPYQFWTKLALLIVSLLINNRLDGRKTFSNYWLIYILVFILPWLGEKDGHQYFRSISSQFPWV